jgi:hypothetical protein
MLAIGVLFRPAGLVADTIRLHVLAASGLVRVGQLPGCEFAHQSVNEKFQRQASELCAFSPVLGDHRHEATIWAEAPGAVAVFIFNCIPHYKFSH